VAIRQHAASLRGPDRVPSWPDRRRRPHLPWRWNGVQLLARNTPRSGVHRAERPTAGRGAHGEPAGGRAGAGV